MILGVSPIADILSWVAKSFTPCDASASPPIASTSISMPDLRKFSTTFAACISPECSPVTIKIRFAIN